MQQLSQSIDNKFRALFPLLVIVIVALLILPVVFEKPELFLIPIGLVAIVFFLFFRKFLFSVLCVTLPLSHEIRFSGINFNISFPGELLTGLLAIWAMWNLVFKTKDEAPLWKHPITWLILAYWGITGVSVLTSSMPGVSFKSFVLLSAYLVVFYYLLIRFIVYKDFTASQPYAWFSFVLFFLVIYISYIHSFFGFDKSLAAYVCKPYFSDHTIYGATLAFVMPFTFGLYWYNKELKVHYASKLFWLVCTCVFAMAIYFSHSRATWMSLIAAFLFYYVLILRIRFGTLIMMMVVVLGATILFMNEISPLLFQNKNDSKAKNADIEEQVKSVTNMKNDVSNAERVNRWLCAWRMFVRKPFTGFGAGTYQYKYLPLQKSSEMTVISVRSASPNHSQGFGGTAHSEYLLALSEIGFLGGIALILMIFVVIRTGMNLYYYSKDQVTKHMAMIITLCMVTYFVHGFFNNFLNTDKTGFLFWAGCAILVGLTIREQQAKKAIHEQEVSA